MRAFINLTPPIIPNARLVNPDSPKVLYPEVQDGSSPKNDDFAINVSYDCLIRGDREFFTRLINKCLEALSADMEVSDALKLLERLNG